MYRSALCLAALSVPLLLPARAAEPKLEDRVRTLLEGVGKGSDADRVKAALAVMETIRRDGIGAIPAGEVVAPLAAAAGDKHPIVCECAVAALAAVRHEAAVPALTKALDHRFDLVRPAACRGLRDLGPKAGAAAPALAAGLAAGRLDGAGVAALAAVVGKDAAAGTVFEAVKGERALPNALDAAATLLAEAADPRAVGLMARVLDADFSSASVRAALYLAKVGDAASLGHLRRSLRRMPGDGRGNPLSTPVSQASTIRSLAVEALGRHKDKEAFDPILKMVEDDPSIRVRTAAAAALGEYADPRAVPALEKALAQKDEGHEFGSQGHRDGELRSKAIASLGRIGTADALAAVYRQLKGGPAKAQSLTFWTLWSRPAGEKAKLLDAFVTLYDADPVAPDVAAGVMSSLLYDKDAKKPTAAQQAAAEAEFRKAVSDPARFGPAADLSEKGKFEVRTTVAFPRDGFATVDFSFRYAAVKGGYGHGYGVLYRKVGDQWRPVGKAHGWVE